MFIEIGFEKNPGIILQQLASRNINIEGSYLDTELDIYRIVVKDTDVPTVTSILNKLGQKYTVSPIIVVPIDPVPGQILKIWLSYNNIAAIYQIENNRVAVRLDSNRK